MKKRSFAREIRENARKIRKNKGQKIVETENRSCFLTFLFLFLFGFLSRIFAFIRGQILHG